MLGGRKGRDACVEAGACVYVHALTCAGREIAVEKSGATESLAPVSGTRMRAEECRKGAKR